MMQREVCGLQVFVGTGEAGILVACSKSMVGGLHAGSTWFLVRMSAPPWK